VHSDLLVTIVVAFVAAFAGGFVAARLGLPAIIGYVLAGVAIGPYTPGGSADAAIATQLAEVGVVLLMFGVGLHFSIDELLAVGRISIPGAVGQSAVATALGTAFALLIGWSVTEGIILGLCLSVASTIVLLRELEDRNLLETHSGHVAVGWLIVEDIFTVVILVMLPVLAGQGGGQGVASLLGDVAGPVEVALSLSQAALFVVVMLVLGTKVVPRLLQEVVRAGSRELFTLSILALALGISFGSAEAFGVSLALGAFLAGIVLNESDLSYRAGLEALPLRDAFAVLFFVSVGMVFDPAVLIEEPVKVAAVVLIVIVGKSLAAFGIVSGLGYGVRTALTAAGALAQVGEFSFILAALGMQLGLLPELGSNLILAAAIISIGVHPFVMGSIVGLERRLQSFNWLHRLAGRAQPHDQVELNIRRHVIICGYGRSGSNLARVLRGRNVPHVVVENDPFVYERARNDGVPVIFGDAGLPAVLEQAQIDEARGMAVTFANQPAGVLTVQNAKTLNPAINVVARGVGGEVRNMLRRSGANEIVDGDFEASLEFVRHVLQRFGTDAREILALQARWRAEYYGSSD
jgi:CPA2 family monovalent cation:H+ antiporter-2